MRSVKTTLYHQFNAANPVDKETFETALIVTEGIINSRPLTYNLVDHETPSPVSPADFLNVPAYSMQAEPPVGGWTIRKKWQNTQLMLDKLWTRFTAEISPYLQAATKWRRETRDLRVGDVVVYLDGERRGKWPLGRIERVNIGRDGHVRTVWVRSQGTVYVRPVAKVMLLLETEPIPQEPNQDELNESEVADFMFEQ